MLANAISPLPRARLYRLLADAGRLRLLALAAADELSLGELAELLGDSQSQVSRRAAPLREAGVLSERREGTRTYLQAATNIAQDLVLADALQEGRRLCTEDGSLARVRALVAAREQAGREFFALPRASTGEATPALEGAFLAHLSALAPLLPGRELAVDVGCGDGALLDVLAPLYERVIGADPSPAQLARAAQRVRARGFANVSLVEGAYDDPNLLSCVADRAGADLVFSARVLHHVSRPQDAVRAFARLVRRHGHLIVLDYVAHHDETMRQEGDVWLGFLPDELRAHLVGAGFDVVASGAVLAPFHSQGPDAHLKCQVAVGRKK